MVMMATIKRIGSTNSIEKITTTEVRETFQYNELVARNNTRIAALQAEINRLTAEIMAADSAISEILPQEPPL